MKLLSRIKRKLGKNTKPQIKINSKEYLENLGVNIGDDCEIYPSVKFGSEPYLITIGDHVRLNEGVRFVTHDGGVWVVRNLKEELRDIDIFSPITIGNNVHIGNNTIIMPGVNIGNNCIIGCGAIVTKDIPSNSIAVGVPAKVIESIDDYINKHINDFEHTKKLSSDEKKEYLLKKYCNK